MQIDLYKYNISASSIIVVWGAIDRQTFAVRNTRISHDSTDLLSELQRRQLDLYIGIASLRHL